MTEEASCFGFFAGGKNPACNLCLANKRCRAILVSHGFDMVAAAADSLMSDLPDVMYRDVERVSELVKQLKQPPDPLPKEVQDIFRTQATEEELSDLDLVIE